MFAYIWSIFFKYKLDDVQVEQAIQNQLLCYLQLLQTTKPYLLNLTRVPGIHILLLFSKQCKFIYYLLINTKLIQK